MSALSEEAKRIITNIKADMGVEVAQARSLVAIALALVDIAEKLEGKDAMQMRDISPKYGEDQWG